MPRSSSFIPLSHCRYLKFGKMNHAFCLLVLPVRHMARAFLAFQMTSTQEVKHWKTLLQEMYRETS